jgi:predicted amidophosphoribosyltransferase
VADLVRTSPLLHCSVCGQWRRPFAPCPTAWCARPDRSWSVAFSVGSYEAGLRRAILRYKLAGERSWAGVFARLVAGYLERWSAWFEDFDAVVPVPAFVGPGSRRSWDPVGTIALELAAIAGPLWEVRPGALTKTVETPPMRTCGAAERRSAVGALRSALGVVDADLIRGRRLLVLDDVLAEGSTLQAVATRLREAGAVEVAGLALARSPWRGGPTPPDVGQARTTPGR